MRIVCLIASLGLGGAEKQMAGLAAELRDIGHDVSVLTYRDGDIYSSFFREKGVRRVSVRSANDLEIISDISDYVKKSRVEVMISFLAGANVKACLVKRKCPGLKLMVSERNFSRRLLPHDWLRLCLYDRWAYKVICNNYAQTSLIASHYRRLSKRLVTIPNFTDSACFAGNSRRRDPLKRIIVTARVCRRKNTTGLIRAVYRLRLKRDDFVVDWYGAEKENRYLKKCRRLISSLGLDDVFVLHDAVENVQPLYRSSDIFCLPSFYEGTSNSLAEALAGSLPIVCSRVGDNVRYVREGCNGFLFDPNNTSDMADALDRALSLNEVQKSEFSALSRRTAEKNFDVGKFRERYSSLMDSRRKIAAMTMVRGGEHFIDKWIDYYGGQFGKESIFVFFDGEDQYIPDNCANRCRMSVYPHRHLDIIEGDKSRARFLSDRAAELLDNGYDMVIGTDVDEFIVPDPAYGLGLAGYLETINPRISVSAIGIDILKRPEECTIDRFSPFIGQRRFGYLSTRYTKCSIVSEKCVWGSGFHRIKGHNYHIDKGLYLFHLGYCDSSVMDKVIGKKGGPNEDWARHRRRRISLMGKCAEMEPVDFDANIGKIRFFQSALRHIYSWNKPSMMGRRVVVRIPERFYGIV